ncbi:MAG TPA: T9SS type A sorting domain-containing protein, partial [Candidatus Absconditabacterales bacterium]|nr:T9SS type A sorting domain-containing protein [Candidatus Absconditabacterales bacterium]
GMTGTAVSNLTVGTYIVTVTDANGCQATTSVVIGQDPVLNATAVTLQNVTCSGSFTGQAEANATGGTAPYSYLWNNGQTSQVASGLAAGSYSVTVTDNNGCQSVANATITEPPLFEAVLSSTDVSCDGSILGTADVVATGGTPAYSYNWNTGSTLSGITGLTTGSYAVTVTDANGCQAAGSPFYFSIGQDPVPVANASIVSGVSTSCSGDPVDLEATGGDTYSWSNGMTGSTITVTPTVPTWYYVTVSNSFGCSDVDSVFVATNEAPIITFVPPTNVCGQSGNPIDLGLYASVYEVGGQTANIWFTGVGVASGYFYPQTVNVGGTYPVTAHYTSSVTGCSDTAVALISVHAPPTTSLNIPQGDICLSDAPFILTGGSPVGGVFSGLGVDAVTGSFDPGLAGVGNHSITYTYTDPHGCEALANDIIIVHAPTSVILSMPATELCEGESMQMSGSPAGGYYLVNGIANSSVFMADDFGPGNYTIVYGLTSAMCGGMDTAYVTVHASPNVTLTGPSSVMVDDPTVMLQISPPGGLLTVDGVPAGVYFDPAYWGVGVHNVVYTYDNGNCSDQASLQITIDAVGIDDVDIASLVTVYPNPVSDILNIEMGENANISEIQIYSILGELVYSSGVDSDVYRVDVSGLAPTVYFIRFVDKDGLVSEPLKFLKQ